LTVPKPGARSHPSDLDLVPDVLIGLNLLQIVHGGVPDRDFVRRVVHGVSYPLATGPLRVA
jgi:hypothetical protein